MIAAFVRPRRLRRGARGLSNSDGCAVLISPSAAARRCLHTSPCSVTPPQVRLAAQRPSTRLADPTPTAELAWGGSGCRRTGHAGSELTTVRRPARTGRRRPRVLGRLAGQRSSPTPCTADLCLAGAREHAFPEGEPIMKVPEAFDAAKEAVTVKRVYGEPYEKDGVTVIPAAAVSGWRRRRDGSRYERSGERGRRVRRRGPSGGRRCHRKRTGALAPGGQRESNHSDGRTCGHRISPEPTGHGQSPSGADAVTRVHPCSAARAFGSSMGVLPTSPVESVPAGIPTGPPTVPGPTAAQASRDRLFRGR